MPTPVRAPISEVASRARCTGRAQPGRVEAADQAADVGRVEAGIDPVASVARARGGAPGASGTPAPRARHRCRRRLEPRAGGRRAGRVPSAQRRRGERGSTIGGLPSPVVVTDPEVPLPRRVPAPPVRGPTTAPGPAPAVVVVLVAHDPGWWFEETLESVAAQDYPNVSVLVVDTASADPAALEPGRRGASRGPPASPRHQPRLRGGGRRGAWSRCRGRPSTCSATTTCAWRPTRCGSWSRRPTARTPVWSGPRWSQWDDPRRCSRWAWAPTATASRSPYVERGDLDQAQHDAVRDVFYVPGCGHPRSGRPLRGPRRVRPRHDLPRRGPRPVLAGPRRRRPRRGGARRPGSPISRRSACVAPSTTGVASSPPPTAGDAGHTGFGTTGPHDASGPRAGAASRSSSPSSSAGFRHARDVESAWVWNLRHAPVDPPPTRRLAAVRRAPDRRRPGAAEPAAAPVVAGFLRGQLGRDESATGGRRDFVSNIRSSKADDAAGGVGAHRPVPRWSAAASCCRPR